MNKKKKHTIFWNNLRFKYKLTITNENTLEEITKWRLSKLNVFSILFLSVILIFSIAAGIIIFTPLRNYLPGYMNTEVRRQVIENALRVDSLQMLVERQNWYVMNIQDIFRGDVKVDTLHTMDSLTETRWESLIERSAMEEEFRRQYEETEKYTLTSILEERSTEGLVFYQPTRGMVTSVFEPENKHFGIDIAANPNESVVAVLEGTVILSVYTAETGYVIQIQHNQDFVSIYKHCGVLLKKEGNRVKAGEAIALVGNTGTYTTGPHLHFELWQKGQPINPEKYIVF